LSYLSSPWHRWANVYFHQRSPVTARSPSPACTETGPLCFLERYERENELSAYRSNSTARSTKRVCIYFEKTAGNIAYSYLRIVESRLHECEAVLGILLSLPEPGVRQVISNVSQDPFSHRVIQHVQESPFGLAQRQQRATAVSADADIYSSRSESVMDVTQDLTSHDLMSRQSVYGWANERMARACH
jgi:hypothetical protein